jgi:Flp pilus assembly protein TadD
MTKNAPNGSRKGHQRGISNVFLDSRFRGNDGVRTSSGVVRGAPHLPRLRASVVMVAVFAALVGCDRASESLMPPQPTATTAPMPPPARAQATIARKLARGDGGPIDGMLAEGDAHYEAGRYVEAANAYARAAERAPDDAAPLVGMARADLAADEVPEGVNAASDHPTAVRAETLLTRATAKDSGHALGQLELGRVRLMLGQLDAAVTPLAEAVKLVPGDAEAQGAHGIALLLTGRAEEGVAALERAAALEPGRADRQANLGTALSQIGRTTDAILAYDRAVALEPDEPLHRSNLGTAFLTQGDVKSAMPHLQRAVELDPERATFRSNLGYALLVGGRIDEAIAAFLRATELDPELVSAWINLGNAHAKAGRHPEARKAYEAARRLDPEDPRVKAVLEELDELEAGATGKTGETGEP